MATTPELRRSSDEAQSLWVVSSRCPNPDSNLLSKICPEAPQMSLGQTSNLSLRSLYLTEGWHRSSTLDHRKSETEIPIFRRLRRRDNFYSGGSLEYKCTKDHARVYVAELAPISVCHVCW
ncbi:ABC transporter C family member 2-like protein [Corchorus olitorius]|uniref:ABC transporter C family member 2-like protein n=1 Tax=Corchorus olitorius TaxID=93759 RepID=A0A1R3FUU2_9ROSI|nr:ABC transporter C family member 2-like protein [Corchorus olitorius]